MTCLSDGRWSGNTTTFCKGWFIFEKEAIFFFFSARVTLDRMGKSFIFIYLGIPQWAHTSGESVCLKYKEMYGRIIS